MKDKIRIGCGAGFSGDRLEPAIILAEKGELDYLVLECLAERTIALAQKRKLQDSSKGYDILLERRIYSLLPALKQNKVRLITNMGAANPLAAAKKIIEIAKELNIEISVAAVTGDDVFDGIDPQQKAIETNEALSASGKLISANAYLGVDAIIPALQTNADIIITGRVADPSLFLAPMVHEFSWSLNDYNLLAKGTVIGHLLECAGQITGGYFADPGKKDVPDISHLGHPFAEVFANGSGTISKVAGTGGIINLQIAKEQLLYEVVNPYEYVTPDVTADFTTVSLEEKGRDRIRITGGSGKTKPATYKVSVGYHAFYLGEGEISYAGNNAQARAQLAASIITERLKDSFPALQIDYIGSTSVHYTSFKNSNVPYETRLRVAAKADSFDKAAIVGEEVEALYTNGPAGGGGVRKYVNEVIGIVSTLIEKEKVQSAITLFHS
jgi:acyclic terpene utilization AtuA family protein